MNNKAKAGIIILISAAVAGLVYPVLIGLPGQDENVIPREASKWHVGKGSEYGPIMVYDITTKEGNNFSTKIEFFNDASKKQMIFVEINDISTGKKIEQNTSLSSAYTFGEVSNEATPYFRDLDKTIFSFRDIALDEKYLIKKAVWDTVFIGASTIELTVTEHEKTTFRFGSVDAFILSYTIGNNENKFWIVDNLPLPVKAEVYDIESNLEYSYELTSLSAPLTPGFS
ncbi:MAG: hypothetical protein ACT4N5_03375 [Nitrosopumilaceae archaeon]